MLLRRHRLVAEEDEEVFGQRAVELIQLAVGERPAQIDASDLRADHGRKLIDDQGLVSGALGHLMADARPRLGVEHHGRLRGWRGPSIAGKWLPPRTLPDPRARLPANPPLCK